MNRPAKGKILLLDELINNVERLKKTGKVVVHSHGIFDIIHPGIIKHLESAKSQGDALVVTVIKDRHIRRGPGIPVFPENLRAENVAALSCVDYVCVVDDEAPFECVKRIKPDIFAKGQPYDARDANVDKKVLAKEKELYFGRVKIFETDGFLESSTEVIKNFLNIYPTEVRGFLKGFSKRHSFSYISDKLNTLKELKVLLLGDGIIDEYHYCEAMGRSAKAPIIVNKYLAHEVFAGGAFAIANHLAGLCNDIQMISLLGRNDSREEFIQANINPKVKRKLFYRDDGPTIIKKRYINQYLNQKLFEVNYINDNYISPVLEAEVIDYLKSVLSGYDIVLISDFGHGFITDRIINFIEKNSPKFAVNTQTNGANIGYNMITKYRNPAYVCLDESEVRLSAQDRFGDIEEIVRNISKTINSGYFIVTRGKSGSIGISRERKINRTPAFSTNVVDTVGAGDAFFAYTAPCVAQGMPLNLVSFIGNAVGAIAVQIVGNKKAVEKHEFLEFARAILK